jgi:hypothetical protein
MITRNSLNVGVVLLTCLAVQVRGQTCDNTYQGPNNGEWQVAQHWSASHEPLPTEIVCIPANTIVRVAASIEHEAEAEAIIIDAGEAVHVEHRRVLNLYGPTDSRVDGTLKLVKIAYLAIANNHKITGNGGQIWGVGVDPNDKCDIYGPGTLTIEGENSNRANSLVVHGDLNIYAPLVNKAYVVADDSYLYLLSSPKTGAKGFWIAEKSPLSDTVGILAVNVSVSGSGIWQLVDNDSAKIEINAVCNRLGGPVELTKGTLAINETFITTGPLTFQSVNGSEPVMDIAPGKAAYFDR